MVEADPLAAEVDALLATARADGVAAVRLTPAVGSGSSPRDLLRVVRNVLRLELSGDKPPPRYSVGTKA